MKDDVRKLFTAFQFEQSTKNKLVESLNLQNSVEVLDKQLVKYRVFLKDYQENELYIGT